MNALESIAETTRGTKWENRIYLVGGTIRDELLGLGVGDDLDIVCEEDAVGLAKTLRKHRLSSISPVIYQRFGTALVMIEGTRVELATARKESYESKSRKPRVEPATLLEDMQRRDFTINALARNIHTGELIDLLGNGLSDLKTKVLRTPLDPEITFRDDPLRMLRAVRFKNRFGLTPAPGLFESIKKEASRLKIVSMERIRDEVVKMLFHKTASQSFQDLLDLKLLECFIPELVECVGVTQGDYHKKDVWGHTLDVVDVASKAVVEQNEETLIVLLSALFHDIGKPRTRIVDEAGRIRFFGHEKVGSEMAVEICRRLRFNRYQAIAVGKLVKNHMRLGSAIPFTLAAARRVVSEMGSLTDPLLKLVEADCQAIGRIPKGIDIEDVREKITSVGLPSTGLRLESPLSGREIMDALGIVPGRRVGELKKKLVEAVLDGVIQSGDKVAALEFIRNQPTIEQE